MKNLIITGLVLAALTLFTSCEIDEILDIEDAGVYGVVLDFDTGMPIKGATVHINGPESMMAVTDANGNYRFEDLELGSYTLSANMERYLSPYVEVNLLTTSFVRQDIVMEYETMLSTRVLDFGTHDDEMETVVTNHLDRTIDVDMEASEYWVIDNDGIFNLEPGESGILSVRISRILMDAGVQTAALVVNIEEDFGFDVYESYVVEVRAEK